MSSDMNRNDRIRGLKQIKLPEIDVTEKVMKQVYAYNSRSSLQRRQRSGFKARRVWIAACALLLIASATVSASTLFKADWNGIQVSIINTDSPALPVAANEPSYRKKLEAALAQSATTWSTISLDEAAKQFPFPLLRPKQSEFTLVQTYGVVPYDKNYRLKSVDEWWLGGFYDIYEWKQKDIVVLQNLDAGMTESLEDPKKTMSLTFHEAAWENVEISDDVLAMYRANGTEKVLIVKYKTADLKVIDIELTGDVAKEDLVKLAKTYVKK